METKEIEKDVVETRSAEAAEITETTEAVEAGTTEAEGAEEAEEAGIPWAASAGDDRTFAEQSPEDEAAAREILTSARQAAEVPEEEWHPTYRNMVAVGAASGQGEAEDTVAYGKCFECGARVPMDQITDNGNYLVCNKCC